jgi:glycerophosphoryl diester phosphodiesterase
MFKSFFKLISYYFLAYWHKVLKPPVPDTQWELFDSAHARPLPAEAYKNLEGVYAMEGESDFGSLAVLKWSSIKNDIGTTHYLSFFCKKEAAYFICRGKEWNGAALLNGYWRKAKNRKTGKARFIIAKTNDTEPLSGVQRKKELVISGHFGNNNRKPDKKISLKYLRPLYTQTPLEIIAHRGGGRNGDLLPASENYIELIEMASRLGATGVEIDVQQSGDGKLVLFHDDDLNVRLTQKTRLKGKLEEHSFSDLASGIKLKNGERIPALEDALDTVVHKTGLRYVWLDVKNGDYLQKTRELQAKALQAAAAIGREIEITIGIRDENLFERFLSLPGYQNIPSLCELDTEYAGAMNARIWAPNWTNGLQIEQVQKMQALGKRVFVWTIDGDWLIEKFMNEAGYDGIVSNHPSLVAFYYYTKQ